jgi:Glycosyl transferase family 2
VTENASASDISSELRPPARDVDTALVTVVVPAFNAATTIEATLASVTSQTHRNLEIIVVDDGSVDQTAAMVTTLAERDPRIRLVRKSNAGLAAARNTGIEHASGAFIAPVDSDDLWHPTKIEKQLAVMQHGGAKVGAVYCWSRAVGSAGQIYFDLPTFDFRGDVFAPLIFWNFIHSGSLLFRRDLAKAIGGYDVSLATRGAPMCEDLKFNLDLAERCDFDLVPEFLTGYTLRHGSMSTNTAAMLRSRLLVITEVQAKHPELPPRLFRWASAIAARESSRMHLLQGRFPAGLALLLRAAMNDPLGAISPDVARIIAGSALTAFGIRDSIKASLARWRRAPAPEATRGRNYFWADPRMRTGRNAMRWGTKRLDYVGNLRIARPQ